MKERGYFNISYQVSGTDDLDGNFPNPWDDQTLLCTSYRFSCTCGMIHQHESVVRVQPSQALAPQARRRLQSRYFTFRCLQIAMWTPGRRRKVAQVQCFPYLLYSSHMKRGKRTSHPYPGCATLRFGKSWVHRSELLFILNVLYRIPVGWHLSAEGLSRNYDPP